MEQGIALIEATTEAPTRNTMPINLDWKKYAKGQCYGQQAIFPTGRFMVVTKDGVRRVLQHVDMDQLLKAGKAFLDPPAYQMILDRCPTPEDVSPTEH